MIFSFIETLLLLAISYSGAYTQDLLYVLAMILSFRCAHFYLLLFQLLIGLKQATASIDYIEDTFLRLALNTVSSFILYTHGFTELSLIAVPFLVINTFTLLTSILLKNDIIQILPEDELTDDEDD